MPSTIGSMLRLCRAGFVMAQFGVRFVPKGMDVPVVLRAAQIATWPVRLLTWPFRPRIEPGKRVSHALTRLGPSYIKLGQFLATRADLIGPALADDLANLRDRLPPFSMKQARAAIERAFGGRLEDHYTSFHEPVAAASIAQVHRAAVIDADGTERDVAVKILRPGVERQFQKDLDSYRLAAQWIEKLHPPSRRLRPVAVIENLEQTTEIEMDLRLEAAAISEMADNIKEDLTRHDGRFRVPSVDWKRTSKRVLTLEWIDGIKMSDRQKLVEAGHNVEELGLTVMRSFLRHAMRDGFFHADMHQGNLFVEPDGTIVAVDFGIMGRLGTTERRFLAEILHGLITRNYHRAAEVHFEAGYVPPHHSIDVFAQAMRAIGEPIHGRRANEISMADLLAQLFAYTDVFDMQTRPELILLQKSMVIVEGVARDLDPQLNMWVAAEPVAREWIEQNLSVAGRLREVQQSATTLGRVLADAPRVLEKAEKATVALAGMVDDGLRIDEHSIERIVRRQAESSTLRVVAQWVIAISLALIAWGILMR